MLVAGGGGTQQVTEAEWQELVCGLDREARAAGRGRV
jgi:hypothetical protein